MMRDLIYLFCRRYPIVKVADRALKRNGFRIMVLLRLCPFLPFNGLNYCCGITGVSLHDFTLSLIGILPFQLYTIMLGATVGVLDENFTNDHMNENQRRGYKVFLVSGIIFGIIAMILIWIVVRKELQRELQLSNDEFDSLVNPTTTTHYNDQYNTPRNRNNNKSSSMISSSTIGTNTMKMDDADDGWVGSTIIVMTTEESSSGCGPVEEDHLHYHGMELDIDGRPVEGTMTSADAVGGGVAEPRRYTNPNNNSNSQVVPSQPQPYSWNEEGEEWYWIWA
jgi:hypothetical protein